MVIAPQPSQIVINNLVINDITVLAILMEPVTASEQGFCRMGGLIIKQIIRTGFTSGLQNIHTDENGCDFSESFYNEPSEILVDSFVVNNYCAQVNQGLITVYAEGGTGLTYLANGNIYPSYEINDLPVGLHDISIVDDNGCTVDSVINLPDLILAFNSYTICLEILY